MTSKYRHDGLKDLGLGDAVMVSMLSRQIYSNYTAILPYTYLGRVLRGEDGGRREERSEVMYCIVRDTYLYIIDVHTDHAVLCVVLFGTHRSIY